MYETRAQCLLEEQLEELLAHGERGADVPPTTLEKNYHTPDTDLVQTVLRVTGRAGAGSVRDMVIAAPRMIAYRIAKGLRDRTGL